VFGAGLSFPVATVTDPARKKPRNNINKDMAIHLKKDMINLSTR
jgi:hypothetical protein